MTRYHLNKKGDPGLCRASKGQCPYGGEHEHYETQVEARNAYEQTMKTQVFTPARARTLRKMVSVSGALAVTFSLAACNNDGGVADPGVVNNDKVQEQVQSWKDKWESPETQEQVQSWKDKWKSPETQEKVQSWKDKAKEKIEEEVKKYEEEYGNTSSTQDPSGVYFQGKPLTPTKQEVIDAKNALSGLELKPENRNNPYNRTEMFGKGFKSGAVSKVEKRDVTNGVFSSSSSRARAIGGNFIDPYTGQAVTIVKGSRNDTNVDHVVPLKEVVESQTYELSASERESIANDPSNLAVVSGTANLQKGAGDAKEYLPSYEPAQCVYVIAQINVKSDYKLSVDKGEYNAMKSVLDNRCETSN